LRSSITLLMLHLSKQSGFFPQCLFIKNLGKIEEHPGSTGSFGKVQKGKIREQIVALKVVKASSYCSPNMKMSLEDYMQGAIVWQQLEHPNILPFMGVCYLDKDQTQPCLVSPWMEQGDLAKYLKATPREDIDHNLL
ncbi:hypothetical protein L218DRAFT_829808, partial [Marasmius fiardii PR-910]